MDPQSRKTTATTSKLSILETVYPPISNQEAVWIQSDPDVEALLRTSDFYMIAARAEAKYLDIVVDLNANELSFTFVIGDTFADKVKLRLSDLPGVADLGAEELWIEAGEKLIRIWRGEIKQEGSKVVEWFTTEKLIWDRARERAGIEGFNLYRKAATYDLCMSGSLRWATVLID